MGGTDKLIQSSSVSFLRKTFSTFIKELKTTLIRGRWGLKFNSLKSAMLCMKPGLAVFVNENLPGANTLLRLRAEIAQYTSDQQMVDSTVSWPEGDVQVSAIWVEYLWSTFYNLFLVIRNHCVQCSVRSDYTALDTSMWRKMVKYLSRISLAGRDCKRFQGSFSSFI